MQDAVSAGENVQPTPTRKNWGLDLRGRVILVLLVVGALSALATSYLGFESGRESLTERIAAQLEGRRDVAARSIERDFSEAREHVVAMTDDMMVRIAFRQLPPAFARLESEPLDEADEQRLRDWYETSFLPKLTLEAGARPVLDAFIPDEVGARKAQALFVAKASEADGGNADEANPNPSNYQRVHDRIHPGFSSMIAALDYEDLFLIDPTGRVLYTVIKEPDFATDLINGPYSQSGLARAFLAARDERGARFVHVEDFDFYRPSLDAPAAFLSAPVYNGSEFLGVVAVQIGAERITEHLGGSAGLGRTGEAFIVGVDGRVRSNMRRFVEDRDAFLAELRATRGNTENIAAMERTGTTILNLDIVSPVIDAAARGEAGVTQLKSNYLAVPALAAYSPLDLPGLDWVMKVELPMAEALEPINRFQRRVLITAVGLAILLTLFSMWAAGWFTKPIRILTERAQHVAGGDLNVGMRLNRGDEFGELSDAMQEMTDQLKFRRDTADAARVRTEALLTRFLPIGIVREVKERDPETDEFNIAEEIEALSVVSAQLTGYEGMMQDTSPLEAIAALDDLVQLVDDAAERAGVEKLRTVGATYLAVAGLSAPQLDHMQRAIEFARDLRSIINRFKAETGIPIGVQIGIASGPVVVGVIGRQRLSFDMYGPAIGEADALRDAADPGEIRLGAVTAEVLGDAVGLKPASDGKGALLQPLEASPSAAKKPAKAGSSK